MLIINLAKKIDALLAWLSKSLMTVSAIALSLLALLIGADVLSRLLLNKSIVGVAEVVANTLLIIAFLQLSYTVRIGGLLRTELTDTFAPRIVSRTLWLIGHLLGAVLFSLIAYYSWDPMVSAWIRKTFEGHASLRVPTFPSRFAIVVCSAFAVINFITLAIRSVLVIVTGDDRYITQMKEEEVHLG